MPHLRLLPGSAFALAFPFALALGACNTTNVDKDNDGRGGGGGGGAIGKAAPFNFSDTAFAAVVAELSGDYDVAIFAARDSLASNVGKGTLSLKVQGDSVVLALKDAGGRVLARRSVLSGDRDCGDGSCFNVWGGAFEDVDLNLRGPGHRLSVHEYWQSGNTSDYFEAAFYEDGVISGTVTGYRFRNSVLAYGPAIPAQLKALAGTYTGPSRQLTCAPNPVTVTVNADSGTVRVQGKTAVSCTVKDHVVAWNGNDDLVIPVGTGDTVKVILNLSNSGGSQPGGGVFLTLPAASATTFSSLAVNFAGAEGGINLVAPVKQ